MKVVLGFAIALCAVCPMLAIADASAEAHGHEIERLIDLVGTDGCSFVRNGQRLRGKHARAHLRSKVERNARLVTSAESFIEKIASRSATTGRPYLIRCRGREEQPAGDWFAVKLDELRSG